MPIVTLQENVTPRLTELGRIRKGGPKQGENRFGKDLEDTFRFIGATPRIQQEFDEAFPPGEVNHLDCILAYKTPDEIFDLWFARYNTGGTMLTRCDGRTIHWERDDKGRGFASNAPCPGAGNPDGCGKCTRDGKLFVVINALKRFGHVAFMVGGKYDIISVTEAMITLQDLADELGRKTLRGMPVVVGRKPKQITVVKPEGGIMSVTKSLIYIEPHPSLHRELEIVYQSRVRRLNGAPVLRLTDSIDEPVDTITGEIVNEGHGDVHGGASDAARYVEFGDIDETIWERFGGSSESAKQWALETGAFDSTSDLKSAFKSLYEKCSATLPDAEAESVRDLLLQEWVEFTLRKLDPTPEIDMNDVNPF